MRSLLLLCLASAAAAFRLYNTTSSPQQGVVNIHLLCHSHDDVGWLKSPNEYFLGSRVLGLDPGGSGLSVYYANGAVQYILTSVVDALTANPDRRFVVVEQWFFQRWWNQQDSGVQQRVRALVASKQLVFANGGLVMHDEAGPVFGDMLDQTSAGALACDPAQQECQCQETPTHPPTHARTHRHPLDCGHLWSGCAAARYIATGPLWALCHAGQHAGLAALRLHRPVPGAHG